MKQDIYGHEDRYKNWKEHVTKNGEEELSKINSNFLIKYIFDMEVGLNTASNVKKGARSHHRLNALRQKVLTVFRFLEQRKVKNVSKLTDKQIQSLFNDMASGVIKTNKGGRYKSTVDYIKAFKAFWHWHMKVNAKEGIEVKDITEYIDTTTEEKILWVYLDEKQMEKFLKVISPVYLMLCEFMYCSGARVTESLSLYGKNITQDGEYVYVDIDKNIAKSIGRKIKLMLCGKNLLQYIEDNNIGEDDLLFPVSTPYINRHLKEKSRELFGEGYSKGGDKYSNISLYDFRRNSVCYWLPRYKTNSAMMYKFGWKSEKFIYYYSEFLGLKDPIRDEDLYVDVTKTELQRKIDSLDKWKKANEKNAQLATDVLNKLNIDNPKDKEALARLNELVTLYLSNQ